MTLTADVTNIVESIESVLDTDLLKLSGGTLTGPLIISDATTSLTAAGDINIAGGVIGGFFELNTGSPFHTAVEGQMAWNDEEGTFDLGLKNSVTYEMGMKLFMPPTKNNSGVQINKGEFVMATGAQGDRITIAKAVTDGSIDPQYMIGIAADDIASGSEEGLIVTNGTIKGIDTNAFPIGTVLYPDNSTAGALTDTQPNAPNIRTSIAIVLRQHASTGRIYVRMTNGSVLGGTDSNVKFDSLAEDDIIVYDNASDIWINKNIGTAISDVGAITLSDSLTMSDPSIGIIMGSGGPKVLSGSGSPEGVVTAEVGSIWMRTDGGVGTTVYYKVTGTGNVGWYSANSTSADVVGPVSSTDNEIVRFDGTTGKNVQGTGGKFVIDDDGNIDSDGGGDFAGDLTITKTTALNFSLSTTNTATATVNAGAGRDAKISIKNNNISAWDLQLNGVSGALEIKRYSSGGSSLGNSISIARSSGITSIYGEISAYEAIYADKEITLTGPSTYGIRLGYSGPAIKSGPGSPESVVTAPVGSIWFQTDSTVGVTHWRKASGTGNTGWVVMSGDTGWRDVSADLTNGWTGTLQIRRINDVVHLRGWSMANAAATNIGYYALPTPGWRPASNTVAGTAYSTTNATIAYNVIGSTSACRMPYTGSWASHVFTTNLSWIPNEAWPTSLPGSAA